MMQLPNNIILSARNNKTSLGDNPCLPPEEEENYITSLLTSYFKHITKDVEYKNVTEIQNELSKLVVKCKKLEKENKQALEEICVNCITELFQIPEDTLDIKGELVGSIEKRNDRLIPEKTSDFSFESVEDMNNLTEIIYKRRMLNSIVAGAALYYTKTFMNYFQKVFELVPELPHLYIRILKLNEILNYLIKDSITDNNGYDAGFVDVYFGSKDTLIQIKAQGVIFPILLNELIKGILEVAIAQGLPKDREKAKYVVGKADFKLAELWDIRIGCPLWQIINREIESIGYNAQEVGINFIIMYFALMDTKEFNENIKEILAQTKKGKEILLEIIEDIITNKEKDEFDDFMKSKNMDVYNINDEEYFDAEELITDSL